MACAYAAIGMIPADWRDVLGPVASPEALTPIAAFVAEERRTSVVFPSPERIFAALEATPYASVRAVILGQDPYPTTGHAEGLAFSVPNDVFTLPRMQALQRGKRRTSTTRRAADRLESQRTWDKRRRTDAVTTHPKVRSLSMTIEDDHGTLPEHAERLVERLERLRSLFVPSRVGHHQHTEFAERSALLAHQLRASLLLSNSGHYAPAFVAIRTALEHHLVDRLLFLANRYLQVYPVKKADVAAEESRLATLKRGPRPDIGRWWLDNGRMNVLVWGLYSTGSLGRGRTLSPYYFVVDQYDPFTGRPKNVRQLAGAFMPIGQRRKRAEESRSVWESLFKYEKLRRNLLLNHLLTSRQALQVDVHYAFLSAFTHSVKRAHDLAYGRNIPSSARVSDHYSSELALLYVTTIASEELAVFGRMAARTPRLRLAGWDVVEDEIREARHAASHLWFLSGEPQLLDRINEVHTRLARRREPWVAPRIDPMTIPVDRVRYYANPLVRLVELHRGWKELTTGLESPPLFPRRDAINRI